MQEIDTAPPAARVPQPIPYKAEVRRKAIHLLALVVPLGMALLGKTWSLALLAPLALLAVAGDVLRAKMVWFAGQIRTVFGSLMRDEEHSPEGRVMLNGATWVLLSAALLVLIFPVRIAVAAFVLFMLGDAAAALVGRRFGRTHWGRSPRTVEGSLAFVVVGLAVVAVSPVVFWVGAVSTVAAALVEVLPGPLNDNLRVPLVAATILFLLERFVLGLDVALFFFGG